MSLLLLVAPLPCGVVWCGMFAESARRPRLHVAQTRSCYTVSGMVAVVPLLLTSWWLGGPAVVDRLILVW